MKRLDANVLLAVATLFPLMLLVMTTTYYEPADPSWRYVATAAIVSIAYLAMQPLAERVLKTGKRPLIDPAVPATAVWASIYPGIILVAAGLPVLFPGAPLGLAVVIASVFFGATVESAIQSLRLRRA